MSGHGLITINVDIDGDISPLYNKNTQDQVLKYVIWFNILGSI